MSANLLPPPPYRLEPAQDDESEMNILSGSGEGEQIATTFDYAGIPGSARALAELFLRCLEQRL